MGSTRSRPAHVVEVRLERPLVMGHAALFARIHSTADGAQKYVRWGEPQALGLLLDDVITVSLFLAQSERQFDRLHCEDFAEVYLPWDAIQQHMGSGVEAIFTLGLRPGKPWLGQSALPPQYRDAFRCACVLAEDDPRGPRLRIGIRCWAGGRPVSPRVPASMPALSSTPAARVPGSMASMAAPSTARSLRGFGEAGSPDVVVSPAVACGVQELSPEEMAKLYQLQARNKELCARLGLRAGQHPDVEALVRDRVEALRTAVAQNYELRAQLQMADKELAVMSAGLTNEQRLAVTQAEATPPPTSASLKLPEPDMEARAGEVMAEIQRVTRGNIELISRYDQQIKHLESELLSARRLQEEEVRIAKGRRAEAEAAARASADVAAAKLQEASSELKRQSEELEALEGECERLEAAVSQVPEAPESVESDAAVVQQLKVEHEVQLEEIGHLREILLRKRDEGPLKPPGTGLLQEQVATLRAELAQAESGGAQQQRALKQQAEALREEAGALGQRLQETASAKVAVEEELQALRRACSSSPPEGFESADEQMRKALERLHQSQESLEKELARSRRRLDFFDQKIGQLQGEAADVRDRAALAWQAVPELPRSPHGAAAAELQATVHQRQEQLQRTKRAEERLREEQDEAQHALEAAKVEAAVLGQKMQLLRNRTSPALG